ncbi:hypothetical protein [Yoonia sp. 2307UL14-13]|uniref:hypothetical protein n=1 Tax=Yoonia sp. 2307UL14-13 TaxID=3126506 RepID=UPI0030A0A779
MQRSICTLAALAALSACASTPNEPSVSIRDVDRAFAEAERISRLPITPRDDVPTGSVTYDGQVGANIRGDVNGSILGDMTMRVDFTDNDIDGNVRNINLIDPAGVPDQRLDGSLDIAGFENRGDLDAGAQGDLTLVDADGFEQTSEFNLDLEGAVYNDRGIGDAVYGTVDGSASGDFDVDVDGRFFGTD